LRDPDRPLDEYSYYSMAYVLKKIYLPDNTDFQILFTKPVTNHLAFKYPIGMSILIMSFTIFMSLIMDFNIKYIKSIIKDIMTPWKSGLFATE